MEILDLEIWERIHHKGFDSGYMCLSNQAQAFIKYHVDPKLCRTQNIIDIGCGEGLAINYFSKIFCEVYGVDSSESALLKAKKNNCNYPNVTFYKLDFRDLYEIKSDSIDYVFSEGVIYYGNEEDFDRGLAEIHRIMKVDGKARIYTRSDRDVYTISNSINTAPNTWVMQNNKLYEDGLRSYLPGVKHLRDKLSKLFHFKLGIEEFNYIDMQNIHSYYVITITSKLAK
jgi:SAM-dependent methyltransferase